jgi:acetyltransferase-like isoleucine patch superfamily enzyme
MDWEKPKIEHNKLTEWNWVVQYPESFILGNNVDIGAFTYINCKNGVKICDNVKIGSHCSIYSISTIDNKVGLVFIGKNSKIGAHSTIMPGIKIGENCIIGAHSFVNKNVPDGATVCGVPIN